MSGIRLNYKVEDAKLQAALAGLGKMDRGELLSTIGEILVSSTTLRFKNSVDPQGKLWKPIKPRRNSKGGDKPLVDYGNLRDSITYQLQLGADAVTVGSDLVYSSIHQFGGRAGRGRKLMIDARPYLGLSDNDIGDIEDLLIQSIGSKLQ